MFWRCFAVLFCYFFLVNNYSANSLVGVDDKNKQTQNLPTNNSRSKNADAKNRINKQNINNKPINRNSDNVIKVKTKDIPDFPQTESENYKLLFDDGFSNIVEDRFQTGEEWDIFVSPDVGRKINKNYIAGHDDDYTQMDAIEAEKKTFTDQLINKDNISTHRTRIMAYLTLDQMIFEDVFNSAPYGYYVNTIAK